MQIRLPHHLAARYKSLSQQARVVTEAWGERNFYCLNCSSPRLERMAHGTRVVDYLCPRCEAPYQLKGQTRPIGAKITDAAYGKMLEAVHTGKAPNLFALHYDRPEWLVRNVILIPRFVFTESILEKRPPLSASAERRGWVGCNFVLDNLPQDARIPLVVEGRPRDAAAVRKQYQRLRPLEKLRLSARGWTLDVFNVIRKLNKQEFTLDEVYAFADELAPLHPKNRHIDEKIRQQLQQLRKLGILEFVARGRYRIRG